MKTNLFVFYLPLRNIGKWGNLGLYVLLAGIMMAGEVVLVSSARADQVRDRQAKGLAAYAMGTVYDLQGASEDAVKEYQKSAEYNDNYAVHLRIGTNYARTGKLEQAIAEFQKVLQMDKDNVQARYLLALVYSSMQEYDKAAENYELILKTFSQEDPQNVEIYAYLGQLYYAKKEYWNAITQFEKVLALQPNNPEVMYVLGGVYLELKDRNKAKQYFSQCVDYKPDHDGCLNSLGYMYAEDGVNLDDARNLVERALAVDPDNGAYLDSLGWVYFRLGQNDKALEFLKKADVRVKDPVIYEHLGDVYGRMNLLEEAKKYWKSSLELLPGKFDIDQKLKSLKSN